MKLTMKPTPPLGSHSQLSTPPLSTPQLPPIPTQALNLGNAILRIAQALIHRQPILLDQPQAELRQAFCQTNTCGQYRPDLGRCAFCGCGVSGKLAWKQKLATEQCPLGYWAHLPPTRAQ